MGIDKLPSESAEEASPLPTRTKESMTLGRPMPRKGHKKSRAGCLVCKKRRVKCDEDHPRCGPCARLKLECQYLPARPTGALIPSSPQSVVPSMLSMEDLRFFQHFLFSAYPSLPVGGRDVWQQLGQMAHHHEFLAHAMLGLGASHLSMLVEQQSTYNRQALDHRVKAIEGLNKHLAKSGLHQAEIDAAFGTLLSLTFQSAYMQDGMVDYFSMVRGCYVITATLLKDFSDSAFVSFARESYAEKAKKLVSADDDQLRESLDMTIAAGFCSSLRRLGALCRSVTELEYLAVLQRIATFAATNPSESFHEYSYMYDKLGELTNQEFALLIDQDNPVSRLIIIHSLTMEFVMGRRVTEDGDNQRVVSLNRNGFDCRKSMIISWIQKTAEELPLSHRPYADWIVGFTHEVSGMDQTEDKIWTPFLLQEESDTGCSSS